MTDTGTTPGNDPPAGANGRMKAAAYTKIFPPCALLIESHARARKVVTDNEQLDSARG